MVQIEINVTPWDIAYFVLVYLCCGCLVCFGYLVYYHITRSIQWKGEAKIEWSYRLYFGLSFEFGKKPIFQLLSPYLQRTTKPSTREIIGLLLGGQRFFFITDPLSAHLVLKDHPKPLLTEPITENIFMNFYNINPLLTRRAIPSKERLQSIHSHSLLQNSSLEKLLLRMIPKMKQIYINELIIPILSSSSSIFGLQLYEFISRCIFHVQLSTLYQPEVNNTSNKSTILYTKYQQYMKTFPLSAGGIHLQYFKPANHAFQNLLTIFRNFSVTSLSEVHQYRLEYFYELCKNIPEFRNQIYKHQLAFFISSVMNTIPLGFWVVFCILYHHQHKEDAQIVQKIQEEIRKEIPNYQSFYESELLKIPPEDDDEEEETPHVKGNEEEKETSPEITIEQFNKLHILDACITEALRLSSGSFIMKQFEENASLIFHSGKEYRFRKGDRFGVSPSVFHYDDTFFENPHDFLPERWLQGETEEEKLFAAQGNIPITTKDGRQLNSSEFFFPFGSESHHCPGRIFTRMEMKMLCILLFLNLDMKLEKVDEIPDFDQSHSGIGIYPPKKDVKIVVTKLNAGI